MILPQNSTHLTHNGKKTVIEKASDYSDVNMFAQALHFGYITFIYIALYSTFYTVV